MTSQWVQLENPQNLLPILHSRLPHSGHVYNIAKMFENWSTESRWFVLGSQINLNSWILIVASKDGFGQEISISIPLGAKVTNEIRNSFLSLDAIDWTSSFMFSLVPTEVAVMLTDICVRHKGKSTEVVPCVMYHRTVQEALEIPEHSNMDSNIKVNDLNNEPGLKFISSTWKYAQGSNKYIANCLSRNPSIGLFIDGSPVAGAGIISHGVAGMLYTLEEHRGKGYAKICMNYIIKKMAENGLYPLCFVEFENNISRAFQKKIGFTEGIILEDVICVKPKFS